MIKAQPVILVYGQGYKKCKKEDATHITIRMPGPTGMLTLPVITKGSRNKTGCWTWNGNVESPTLKPSVLTNAHDYRCHSWVTDGNAQFLNDCSHDQANKTVELLAVT